MKHLIVTADDLGLTKSINEGIAKACREGIVTAVSVIPTGEAFEDALKIIRDLGLKEIGAHLALYETRPVLAVSKFCKSYNEFFFKLSLGIIRPENIYNELKAQLELLKKADVAITHLNSHGHLHIMPKVLDIFIRLAREYSIPAIRYPRGDRPVRTGSLREKYRLFLLNYFSGKIKETLKNSGLAYTDFFMGFLDAGKIDVDILKGMLNDLKDGVTEIVTHPGFLSPEVLDRYKWHIGCEAELFALTDKRIKNAINNSGIKLISFKDFLTVKTAR